MTRPTGNPPGRPRKLGNPAENPVLPDPRDTPPPRPTWTAPNPVITWAGDYFPSGTGIPRSLLIALDTRTLEIAASIDGRRLEQIPNDIRQLALALDGGQFLAKAHDLNLI